MTIRACFALVPAVSMVCAAAPCAQAVSPRKATIMVVSTHPDDEGIFLGGVLPYYTRVLGLPTVHISMTSGDWNRPPEVREEELINADTVYFGRPVLACIGLPPDPHADLFFPRFKDAPTGTLDETWDLWYDGIPDNGDAALGRRKAIETVATHVRTFRPEIIAVQDLDGEYGHNNHRAAAIATTEAFFLAADSAYDDGNTPWQARKLYVHQSEANGLGTDGYTFVGWLFHDYWEDTTIDTDADGSPDMTPRQIADLGLDEHVSQGRPDVSTVYRTGENFDGHHCEWWGLLASTVGPDSIAPDFTIEGCTYVGWGRGDFLESITVCAVDLNGDGLVDSRDFTLFLGLFAGGEPGADFNSDGAVNSRDFIAFLNAFLIGC